MRINIQYSGGFHGTALAVNVRARVYGDRAIITPLQALGLERLYCGIKDCICGGPDRADVSAPAGWTATSEGHRYGGVIAIRDRSYDPAMSDAEFERAVADA